MPYNANIFLNRLAERTSSEQEFVQLFSPQILERLPESALQGGVHIFRSPPGGGKTTLLRAFTPAALRAFWNVKGVTDLSESYNHMFRLKVIDEKSIQALGTFLSCAAGYADLPQGAAYGEQSLFRSLFNCRVVLRSLRSLSALLAPGSATEGLDKVVIDYDSMGCDLKCIPTNLTAEQLLNWAEQRERGIYAELDSFFMGESTQTLGDLRFEGVLWLQSVRFRFHDSIVAPMRLLLIDDVHKLRKKQRALILEELTELRPNYPIWLAERNIALGEELLAQGARKGRDVNEYGLDDIIWSGPRGQHQFSVFGQNILDRRMAQQSLLPNLSFPNFLQQTTSVHEFSEKIQEGCTRFKTFVDHHRNSIRYSEWLEKGKRYLAEQSLSSLSQLYVTRILVARDVANQQLSLDLNPLPEEELMRRDSSAVHGAAEIFINHELSIPYYYGINKLCAMASFNVEELLNLAAVFYEELRAKQVLGLQELVLSTSIQEKLLINAAKKKRDFIHSNHTEGRRAQILLDSIGHFCREKTFVPTASIAPGVTGIRLNYSELRELNESTGTLQKSMNMLRKVLAESVAENLLMMRDSSASSTRDSGTVFYLNRTLCVYYGLPLQFGGWQDISARNLAEWMEHGRQQKKENTLEVDY